MALAEQLAISEQSACRLACYGVSCNWSWISLLFDGRSQSYPLLVYNPLRGYNPRLTNQPIQIILLEVIPG